MAAAGDQGSTCLLAHVTRLRFAQVLLTAVLVTAAPTHLQRFFGFVEATADSSEELLQGLGPQEYETKTRGGGRQLGSSRLGGGGVETARSELSSGSTAVAARLFIK